MKVRQVGWLALCAWLVSGTASAQLAVFDASNLRESIQRYQQMVQQARQLQFQYQAITGNYGIGALGQGAAFSAQSIVPGSWQDVVRLQQSGEYGAKMDYYEGLMKSVEPSVLAGDQSRGAGAYKLSYDDTRAAFAMADATYDSVDVHRQNIEQLMQRIDTTQNIKEAEDLNNRLLSENALLQVSLARLSAVQGNLSASAQNERLQSYATRAEMLRFDPNYQYEVHLP